MIVELCKTGENKWDVESNGEVVGKVVMSNKYDGSYEAKLDNRVTVHAFNQESLKEKIAITL